jgi:hypothetical protein
MTLPRWLEIALMIPGALVYLGAIGYVALMLVVMAVRKSESKDTPTGYGGLNRW